MRRSVSRLLSTFAISGIAMLSACSAGMEANRPVPVDLSQFHAGTNRFDVISVVGAAQGSVDDQAGPCDIYSLYTTGIGGFGKGLVTGTEVLTDIGTLGLAEIIWTPVQASTRPRMHTVLFCYDHSNDLISVMSRDPSKNNSGNFGVSGAYAPVAPVTATMPPMAPMPAPVTSAPVPAPTAAPSPAPLASPVTSATPAQATVPAAVLAQPVSQPAAQASIQSDNTAPSGTGDTTGNLAAELPADTAAQTVTPAQ